MWSRVYHPRSWSDPSWIRSPGRPSAQGTESMPCHVCDPGAHPGLVQSRNRWRRRVGRAANSGPCPFLQGQGGRHGQGPEVPSEAPLVKSRACSKPPSPSVPFLPEVGGSAEEQKRTFPRTNSRARSRGPNPPSLCQFLSDSTYSAGLWEGLQGQSPARASSARPLGSCQPLSWVGAGCARRAWHSSLYCSVVPAPLGCPLGPQLGVPHQQR